MKKAKAKIRIKESIIKLGARNKKVRRDRKNKNRRAEK